MNRSLTLKIPNVTNIGTQDAKQSVTVGITYEDRARTLKANKIAILEIQTQRT